MKKRLNRTVVLVLALSMWLAAGCAADEFDVATGSGDRSSESSLTPLEVLADGPDFELHSVEAGSVPTLLAPSNTDRLINLPTSTLAGFPSVEYRYQCSSDQFAQVFVFIATHQAHVGWDENPDAWRNGTVTASPEVAYGAPHRDISEDTFSHEYVYLRPNWIHSGGAIGTTVVTATGETAQMLFSSSNKFLYGNVDGPKPNTPRDGAFADPYQSTIDCVNEAWTAAASHLEA